MKRNIELVDDWVTGDLTWLNGIIYFIFHFWFWWVPFNQFLWNFIFIERPTQPLFELEQKSFVEVERLLNSQMELLLFLMP